MKTTTIESAARSFRNAIALYNNVNVLLMSADAESVRLTIKATPFALEGIKRGFPGLRVMSFGGDTYTLVQSFDCVTKSGSPCESEGGHPINYPASWGPAPRFVAPVQTQNTGGMATVRITSPDAATQRQIDLDTATYHAFNAWLADKTPENFAAYRAAQEVAEANAENES